MLRKRLTYANVMATLAVFIALGGASYAIIQLPKNSVKARQIAKNAVRAPEVKTGGIASPEILDASLEAEDFKPGELPAGAQGPQGDRGPQGEQGIQGVQGVQGPAGPTAGANGGGGTPVFDASFETATVNAPTSGRIFATAAIDSFSIDCNPNANGHVGLYVDGTGITGTRRAFTEGVLRTYYAAGISGAVAAGNRAVQFGASCDGASTPNTITGDPNQRSLVGILLGG